jgi:signal transduction histidine kinase
MLGAASSFLFEVKAIPMNPNGNYFLVFALSAVLLFNFLLRQFVIPSETDKITVTLLLDSAATILLMVFEDFNYNGIILWIIANFVYYVNSPKKFLAIGIGIAGYIFSNYGLLSIYTPLFSIEKYFVVYQSFTRTLLFILYYSLSALNLIVFIIFCILVIQEQEGIIEEVNHLYSQLSDANKELKKLADIKEKMGETRERNRIAREIHDTIGHSLMSISIGIDAALTLIDNNPSQAKRQLQTVSTVAREGIADIRRSVSALRPDTLGSHRLSQQISHLVDKTVNATGIVIHYTCEEKLEFENDEENAIFRVVQESLTNAIKHGHATVVDITLEKKDGNLLILVRDNGCGCQHMVPGFGTAHMKERIEMLDGSIEFVSDDGFAVKAIIPIRVEGGNDKSIDS